MEKEKEKAAKEKETKERSSKSGSSKSRRSNEKASSSSSLEAVASSTAPPATSDSSDSSAMTSDYEGSGVDADTEDSLTTDEEVDKLVDAATTTEGAVQCSQKWVNLKNAGGPPQVSAVKLDVSISTDDILSATASDEAETEPCSSD